jgi:hypothetical protein
MKRRKDVFVITKEKYRSLAQYIVFDSYACLLVILVSDARSTYNAYRGYNTSLQNLGSEI